MPDLFSEVGGEGAGASRLRICYVLDRPELGGGVKVVFQHAELLRRGGHRMLVVGRGRRPRWSAFYRGEYRDLRFRRRRLAEQDLVIATYWTTLAVAHQLGLGPVAHFCQGFEGDHPHLTDSRSAIEEAYSRPIPALVVSPHLSALLGDRFGRASAVVPPPIDPWFRPAAEREAPRERPWIAIHGIFENPWKGVRTGLEAVLRLRRQGVACRVLRFSLLRLSRAERRILAPDRYFYRLSPRRVARHLRRCDLAISPSLESEGFGLPLLEAMASKVPAVASDIPATRFVTGSAVRRVPPGDAAATAAACRELITDPEQWREAREEGFRRAERFRPAEIARDLLRAVEWLRSETAVQAGAAR